jgi:2-polyprenyl-3-methyl-5-hydroxy-6-metoxy-1,4-benzoquinol methylase
MDLLEVKNRTNAITVRHPWEQARLIVSQKLINRNLKLNDGDVVLDIGCGDTYVIENLSRAYPKVFFYAVDIAFTDEMINHFANNLNNEKIKLFKSLDDVLLPINKTVSLILLMDVIEHIENDVEFLNSLDKYKYINTSTYFFITVPAFQKLFCTHDVFLGHYRRYTNALLVSNTMAANLKSQSVGYFFISLLFPRIFQVFKENVLKIKPKQSTTGLTSWSGSKPAATIMKNILLTDFYCSLFLKSIGINIAGLSNYIICKKSV